MAKNTKISRIMSKVRKGKKLTAKERKTLGRVLDRKRRAKNERRKSTRKKTNILKKIQSAKGYREYALIKIGNVGGVELVKLKRISNKRV